MNCEDVEALLLDFVEGALEAAQESAFNAHLDSCEPCRINVKKTGELIDAMEVVRDREEQSWVRTRTHVEPDLSLTPVARLLGTVLGDFEVLEELGRGGMGVVYRARQVSLDRIVALKVLPATALSSKKAVTRFRKEARAAAKLQHTNIVPVYAQGDHDGQIYYAMELIQGQSLDRVLREQPSLIGPTTPGRPAHSRSRIRRERHAERETVLMDLNSKELLVPVESELSAPTAAPASADGAGGSFAGLTGVHTGARAAYRRMALMVAAVAEGLEHAHRSGVIHRDIKPQNLLLGADGQLHISDFGLARLLDEPNVTVTGEMLGTPAYMSPEQVRADRTKIDHRTDVYSLGVSLYEMLAGRRPFEGPSREQIIGRICTEEPKSPRKWNPAVPVDLETICLRAMEKDARRRYQTAGDMAADLRRYAEDRPIVSRRVGRIERTMKWIRRHPLQTAIASLAVLIVSGGVLWAVQTVKSRHTEANRLVRSAFERLAYEDYREAAAVRPTLERALQLGPDEYGYRVTKAFANMLDDPPGVIADLEWAARQRPDDTEVMYLLAWALRRNEQNPESQSWLDRAESQGGAKTAAAHFFRAQALVRHDPKAALAEYRFAMGGRENYTQAWIHLGRALNHDMYHGRSQENFGEQEIYLGMACKAQPNRAYPRYLLSIAMRLSAEIELATGHEQPSTKALSRLAKAIERARDAQKTEPQNPQGYACEAEYWESRFDYEEILLQVSGPRVNEFVQELVREFGPLPNEKVDEARQSVLPADWNEQKDLQAALDARTRGESHCRTQTEQIEFCQYRWRLHYWLGQLDAALGDLEKLTIVCPASDPRKMWYSDTFKALIAAEQGRMVDAVRIARASAERSPEDFRAVTTSALMLRLLGDAGGAARLLADHEGQVSLGASSWPEISVKATCTPEWLMAIYDACRGKREWEGLMEETPQRGDRRLLRAAPYFLAGMDALAEGEREAAIQWFRRCEATYDYEDYCYIARVFSRRLNSDPSWPPWVRQR